MAFKIKNIVKLVNEIETLWDANQETTPLSEKLLIAESLERISIHILASNFAPSPTKIVDISKTYNISEKEKMALLNKEVNDYTTQTIKYLKNKQIFDNATEDKQTKAIMYLEKIKKDLK